MGTALSRSIDSESKSRNRFNTFAGRRPGADIPCGLVLPMTVVKS